MQEEEIYVRLSEVFRDVFDDEGIVVGPTTCADDIEDWDSLAQITLVLAIEEEFGMRFDMSEIVGLANVGEMVEVIKERVDGDKG